MPEQLYNNKIVANGEVLIDLTADTIEASKVLSGYTFHDASGAPVTGTLTFDADTSDGTAQAGEILNTKVAYVGGNRIVGTMPNRGAVEATIALKDGVYTIPNGYHDGTGTVQLAAEEKAKLIATNIRQGITLFGVEGSMTGTEDVVTDSPTVTPSFTQQVITPGDGCNYIAQVTVNPIAVTKVENAQGGYTVTIGAAA